MNLRLRALFLVLVLAAVSCVRYPSGLVEEFFEEAKEGDLKSFMKHLTPSGQERYGNETVMRNVSDFLNENEKYEFSLDHEYSWDRQNKLFHASAYMAFLQKNKSVYWAKYKLHCLETESVSSGQPYGVKCKVNEIEWPERIEDANYETAWNRAQMFLNAYGCYVTDMKTLMNQEPTLDFNQPLLPSGQSVLEIVRERALSESSRYSECRTLYQTMLRRN